MIDRTDRERHWKTEDSREWTQTDEETERQGQTKWNKVNDRNRMIYVDC